MSSIRLVCLRTERMCFLGLPEVLAYGAVIGFLCRDRELDGWELVVFFCLFLLVLTAGSVWRALLLFPCPRPSHIPEGYGAGVYYSYEISLVVLYN